MNFEEKKHPRDEKGRFTEGGAKEFRQNTSYEKVLQDTLLIKISDKEQEEIAKDKQRISAFIEKKRRGERTTRKLVVTSVNDRARKEIERLTGEPLNALYHSLDIDEIRHIESRHGINGKNDHSMSNIEDYETIVDVLHNFDSIDFVRDKKGKIKIASYPDKNNKPSKLIQYRKSNVDGTFYVVEAITDGKSGDIKIISAYKE